MAGLKPANPNSEKLAGTSRADRHGDIVSLAIVPSAKPEPPEWLDEVALEVWERDLPRAMALGLAAVDQSSFAVYATTMASFIKGSAQGPHQTPTSSPNCAANLRLSAWAA